MWMRFHLIFCHAGKPAGKVEKGQSNEKTFLLIVLALSLVTAIGSTLAYLTDTDSDVDVMTLGDVDIIQYENGEEGFSKQPIASAYYEGDDKTNIDWNTVQAHWKKK